MRHPIVERLGKRHDKSQFDCGKPALTNYLRTIASQHEKRDLGRTYVATYEDDPVVLGYYTLAASRIEFEHWPEGWRFPPGMPIPTLLLGRLAVDVRFKGQGLGSFLVHHAFWRSEQIGREVGAVALEVDAMDEDALGFYERYNFQVLKDNPLHLFLPMATIRQLGLDFSSVTRL